MSDKLQFGLIQKYKKKAYKNHSNYTIFTIFDKLKPT